MGPCSASDSEKLLLQGTSPGSAAVRREHQHGNARHMRESLAPGQQAAAGKQKTHGNVLLVRRRGALPR